MTGHINYAWHQATAGESVLLSLMTYGPQGMRHTHDLSSLGLSALDIYRTCNTIGRAESQATKARGQRDIERVKMTLILVVHAQLVFKILAGEALTVEARTKHDFTKVECLVLPWCNNSFHEKPSLTDPLLGL